MVNMKPNGVNRFSPFLVGCMRIRIRYGCPKQLIKINLSLGKFSLLFLYFLFCFPWCLRYSSWWMKKRNNRFCFIFWMRVLYVHSNWVPKSWLRNEINFLLNFRFVVRIDVFSSMSCRIVVVCILKFFFEALFSFCFLICFFVFC